MWGVCHITITHQKGMGFIFHGIYIYHRKKGIHCKKKLIGCFNHWVVTLVAGNSGYEKFISVFIEVNCISNLSPNHTLQLTTLITSASKSLQLHFDAFVVILSWITISTRWGCILQIVLTSEWLPWLQTNLWEVCFCCWKLIA